MKVFVNSECIDIIGEPNILDLLKEKQITSTNGMAIAVNQSVIPKNKWSEYFLNENDSVLIIMATQGG